MRVIAGKDPAANKTIDTYLGLVNTRQKQLMDELFAVSANKTGSGPQIVNLPHPNNPTARKVPSNIASMDEYFTKRKFIPTGMHSHMYSETMNFVDGKRTYYSIYKAVKAEALAAGKFYYGTVTFDDVVKVLDGNVASGALTVK
jgi:hypothetical protein